MNSQLISLYEQGVAKLFSLRWIVPLLARVTIGVVFIQAGWGKLHNLPKVVDFFRELGIPAAELQAPFVASVELGCGFLVLIGLGMRFTAIPLIGTMVVALATAFRDQIASDITTLFTLSEFLYIILLLGLVTRGPGPLALDCLVAKRCKSSST